MQFRYIPHLPKVLFLIFISVVILAIVMIFDNLEEDYQFRNNDGTISPDDTPPFDQYPMSGYQDQVLIIEFSVTEGSPVDAYLLDSSQFESYWYNEHFNATRSWINTTSFSYSKSFSSDKDLMLIIDMQDNARPDDSIPQGNTTYEMKYRIDQDWYVIKKDLEVLLPIIAVPIIIIAVNIQFMGPPEHSGKPPN